MPSKAGKGSGHSSTAFQRLKEQIKYVDLIIEVLDSRAPLSSRHPKALEIFGHKPRLVVLAKEDLADKKRLNEVIAQFKRSAESDSQPCDCLALSLKTERGKEKVLSAAVKLTARSREALARKGLLPRPMRAVVVGMPNVGKSSLINWLIGRKKAKVADRPGVTRGPQWVRVHPDIELLDTPGILPTVSFKPDVHTRLALFNLVAERTYDHEEVARAGFELFKRVYPDLLSAYISGCELETVSLEEFATRRSFLTGGARPDTSRAAATFLADLRNGRFGRVTLDAS